MELSAAKKALLEQWLNGQVTGSGTTIPRSPDRSDTALSLPQQRQLFLELLEPGTAVNNLSVLLEINGNLDIAALEDCANTILSRHEILRTRFSFNSGLPKAELISDLKIAIRVIDLTADSTNEKLAKAKELAQKEALQPFDLTRPPLIRLNLYAIDRLHYCLLILVHHTIADGWSLGVFLKELMTLYEKGPAGDPNVLPELPIQYADYAKWQTATIRNENIQEALHYWKQQLHDELPVLELPCDHIRGSRQTFNGKTFYFTLSPELSAALGNLAAKEDATMFMALLSGFYSMLHRYSAQDDILVGTPVANRNLPELQNLIGVFINTIVLRIKQSGQIGFRELLRTIRKVSLDAFAHQDLPFEKLVEELKPRRDLSRTPIFQVLFNLQNAPMPAIAIPGLIITPVEMDRGVAQFDLTLMMKKKDNAYLGIVEYNSDLFSHATIERMFHSFRLLLEEAVLHPDRPISDLAILPESDRYQLLHAFNQTQLGIPRDKCIHQLFEEQSERSPDAIAVMDTTHSLTYRQLNARANLLAKHLLSMGVGSEGRIGLLMDKSADLLAALLGILKAGAAYVPIHTAFPEERIRYILKDANVQVLLTTIEPHTLPAYPIPVMHIRELHGSEYNDPGNAPNHSLPGNLAYIMYTSGSTGQPKGVMIEHASVVNFLWSMRLKPGMHKEDILLSVTPISFDIAALELFLPIVTGATVVIANKEESSNPILLSQLIRQHRITIMQATPATWQLLLNAGWEGNAELTALCGGEALTRKLADHLLKRAGTLWNMYGPTETTIWSSVARVSRGSGPITIGQPIGNTRLYILDARLHIQPIGVVGELYVGGEGLARGYLHQPILTSEKFIPDPFSTQTGARLYRTGDNARYLADGSIEVLGRMDDQVKINGHRIELGEISSILMQHASIQEATVIVRTENNGEKRLVAYFVPTKEETSNNLELTGYLRNKLPAYMIPDLFVPLKSFPLSANGKIDRKALPRPVYALPLKEYAAPGNEMEKLLAGIWQDVLNIEQVGINDNFFDLGGASIQSLQVVAIAGLAGLHLKAEDLFEHQTIEALAAHVTTRQAAH
ncbi:non-ribosomal peptide synthetase [Flavihumibacter stibioxidans]|uniref:Carrier domain-containing protein n=1 Tax=Flavihumibacter stibioxidans TaxID=1834163 RepID=A0ABR7MBD6_9BACT|nr:non-ribosomal peptide synthetase [Flavihumibacter stibioxidans]MBC6492040.1 hypothetical protein [Flavihumibacter stibioxidans]